MLRVGMLGPFDLRWNDGPLSIPGERLRSVLAILALTPGVTVTSETLLSRCWDEDVRSGQRDSLYTAIRRLRRILAELPAAADPGPIQTTDDGYRLDAASTRVDVAEFERLLAGAGSGERDRLDAALALWRGEPFTGDFCTWLQTNVRPLLVERWLGALERRADLDLAAGEPDRVLADLQRPAATYPLRETLWVRILTALDRLGRRAEALDRYGDVRARLADELGVEPDRRLRAVFEDLLAHDARPPGEDRDRRPAGEPDARPDPRAPRADPAAGSVAGSVAVPSVPPEPAGTGRMPQQLPSDVPRFLGRHDLLDRLDRLVDAAARSGSDDAPTTKIVLDGLGGSGKTCLAVHWAHRAGHRFPDGRLFLDLHGYGPGEPVRPVTALGDLLHGLGLTGGDIPSGQDARSALLRSVLAGRQMLLVLDNARDEEQVRPLLPGAGGVVVVTSRARMSGLVVRDGAQELPVTPLARAEAAAFLGARLDLPAAELGDLAGRCGGLPLALEIVAQRVLHHRRPDRVTAPDDRRGTAEDDGTSEALAAVLAALDERSTRLDALAGHEPASDVRTVLSWSYAALPPETARFFRLLGVAVTPVVTAGSAAALTGTSEADAARVLGRLAELNLLIEICPGRYRLHDLLAPFAAERCVAEVGPEERVAAETRMLEWYVHSVYTVSVAAGRDMDPHDPGLRPAGIVPAGVPDAGSARAWLRNEASGLAEIVGVAARRQHHGLAARLGVLLWDVLYRRAATDEAETVQRTALDSARRSGLRRIEGRAVVQLGTTSGILGDLERAEEEFARAARMFEADGDASGGCLVNLNLAHLHRLRGDDDACLRHAETALVLARKAGESRSTAGALDRIAMAHLRAGRIRPARAAIDEGCLVGVVDGRPTPDLLGTLGQVLAAEGEWDAAVSTLQAARRRHEEEGDRYWVFDTLVKLGTVLRDAGRNGPASDTWREALDLLDQLGGPRLTFDRGQILDLLATVTAEGAREPA